MSDFLIVVLLVILFAWLYANGQPYQEGFGQDQKPFEPDNSVWGENPWDNINYIRPAFVV